MSGGSSLAWIGLGLIGVALLAPSLQRAEAPAPAAPAPSPAAPVAAPPPTAPQPAGIPASGGPGGLALTRSPDGHFYAEARVNGAHIRFMVDTGASIVALTRADAQRAGITLPSERMRAMGAGGEMEVAPVVIDRIAVGSIEARDVRGVVADALPVSLLGQNFLGQIGAVEIRGDRMVMR